MYIIREIYQVLFRNRVRLRLSKNFSENSLLGVSKQLGTPLEV